jgi:hypothetical protein
MLTAYDGAVLSATTAIAAMVMIPSCLLIFVFIAAYLY